MLSSFVANVVYSNMLRVAFNNFFEKRANYPRFKSKHGKQSIQYPQNVKVSDSYLTLSVDRE